MSLFAAEHETIEGVGRALRSGRTTCVEVLNKCLDRIEEWEGRVKAWVRVDRLGAIAQAEVLDEELASGHCRGPLHGIPFGVKDVIDVEGLPTAAGFAPWRDRMPGSDAFVVFILRFSGAVIVGKTVTTQFAWIDPPPTRNPWDLNRTPGGSSSGSAVAVALGMCLGALGTQTGGSIIRPAAFCGVAGFKPAYDLLGVDGIVPLAPAFDHVGAIARTVGDLRLVFREVIDFHEILSKFPAMPSRTPQADNSETGKMRGRPRTAEGVETLASEIVQMRDRPPRLLFPRGFFDRRAEPVMLAAFEQALATLVEGGAEVVQADDDEFQFEAMLTDHRLIMAAQAAAVHEERFHSHAGDYAPHIRKLIEEGFQVPLTHYIRTRLAVDDRFDRLRGYFGTMEGIDAIVTPAAIGPAPDVTTTGNPCFNSPFSYLGWPAATFPIGLSPEGLPLAIQLVCQDDVDLSKDHLLAVASWCEAVIRSASRPGTSAR